MSDLEQQGFRLGNWKVYPLEGRILNGDVEGHLSPKSMEVLIRLAREPRRVFSRGELLTMVWGERAVSDEPLTRCISELRRGFGDSRTAPEIIETISKRGYRLVATVELLHQPETQSGQPSTEAPVDCDDLATTTGYQSIAVLPFTNISGDPEQEYFSDGITEDITTALSRMPWFWVAARNSSFAYKGRPGDVKDFARELGVQYVLMGGVRKSGKRIRITAQFVDASTGNHVWAEHYDRELVDIFAIQDEVAESIVGAVAPEFLSAEATRARQSTKEVTTWDCVIHGRWHLWKLSRVDLEKARKHFERAIELEPSGIAGASDLSLTLLLEAYYNWAESREESLQAMTHYAELAVIADIHNPWAHTVLCLTNVYSHKFDEVLPPLQRAIELSPDFAPAWGARCIAMAMLGRAEESLESYEKAIRLSPHDSLMPLWLVGTMWAYWISGRDEEALSVSQEFVRLAPDNPTAQRQLIACYAVTGQKKEARQALKDYMRHEPEHTVADIRGRLPSTNPDQVERYIDALRSAGLKG